MHSVPVGDSELGSLSNDDGNGNENVTRKYIFISFVLLRDYFNSLNLNKNGELSRNQIGRSGVQVKKENEKLTVVRSVLHKSLRLCSHGTGPKWIRPYPGTDHFCSHCTVPLINVRPHGTGLLLFGTESK